MASSQANGVQNDHSVAIPRAVDNPTAELSTVVDELLTSLSAKFSNVSAEIFAKMDEMSKRLDSLEATVQVNTESTGSPIKQ